MEYWKEIAKQNGIGASMFWNRVHASGWSPEKAATTPIIQRKRDDQEWIQLAKKNGVSYKNYLNRRDKGWTAEEAATLPIGSMRNGRSDTVWIKKAEENGIPSRTYRRRVDDFGWTPEKAATTPVIKRDDQEWVTIAKQNGIPYSTYYFRVDELFWSPEEAATTPIIPLEERVSRSVEERKALDQIRWDRINKDPNNLFKLTPQHLHAAAENGVCEHTVRNRVYYLGWTVQDAITVPVKFKKSEEYIMYREKAKENGISTATFRERLRCGWTLEDAATIEIQSPDKRRRSDAGWHDKAVQNGIHEATYRYRINRGWTPEEAATIPTLRNGEFLNETQREKKREGFKKFRRIKKR